MSNILTIAQKEFRSYFATPIAYAVVGLFALLFGWFFVSGLAFFAQVSSPFGGGPPSINVNELLVRPLLGNATVLLLLVLPLITMRTYAEEKRSGTMELLLTSPLTDVQIVLGKFLGAMALYTLMLAVTLIDVGILFRHGNPEWQPIATGYLGLWLMGGSFISIGLFLSSTTKNQIVAGMLTFAVVLLLYVMSWMSDSVGPTGQAILTYLSVVEHFDDFSKGVIDTSHLAYYASFIGFGLFLTVKSVDSERWRG